jgi:AraC family transcriptional regulator
MKATQRALYADRIERVVRHLEQLRGEEVPRVGELAKVAAMSEFHFHRVFRLMTGESIGETVRRVRLARAVPNLARQATVTEASQASGYSTPQGFARALRAQTGSTPSNARNDPKLLEIMLRHAQPMRRGDEPVPAMAVDIVSVAPFRLLAIRNVGAYEELNSTYTRLFEAALAQLNFEDILGLYGVQFDDPRFTLASDCRATCAIAVGGLGKPVDGLEELSLGGGSFARLRHNGSYDLLPQSIDTLYAHTIVTIDREFATQPPHIHYLDDPEQVAEADLRCDVYLPIN